ncbi:MAG: hypothetical protein HXJ92_00735, partial [candidate division SR1 bacterium]|nr:hypothetical protein [candidate division SR1 bacterium]
NIAYIIVRPLVSLAGIAMDNQMVYGSFMFLDAPLRKLRNLVKNLANFALGFLFLAGILGYVLSPGGLGKIGAFKNTFNTPVDLIKKTLIAGVLIQMSWFIMMVLVDLSTILTYSVGALPSSIISQVGSGASSKVLSTNIVLNMGDAQKMGSQEQNKTIVTYSTLNGVNGTMNIAPCLVVKKTDKESYIVGREYDYLTGSDGKVVLMNDGYCTYYSSLFTYIPYTIVPKDQTSGNSTYRDQIDLIKNKLPGMNSNVIKKLREAGMVIQLWSATQTGVVEQNVEIGNLNFIPHADRKLTAKKEEKRTPKVGVISNKQMLVCSDSTSKNCSYQYQFPYSEYGMDTKQIIEKAKSRSGPFVTLYSSLMDYSSSVDLTNHGLGQKFLMLALNVGLAILLVLPLAALVVVLLWRVIVLWVAIAISPFLVLKEVFKGMFGDIGGKMDFLDVGEIIKLLFAPVLVAFAVGISLIFLSAIKESLPASGIVEQAKEQQYRYAFKEATGMELSPAGSGGQELSLLGMIKIKADVALINFSWLILMIFGMALTWFLLFWAVKSTNIGAKVGEGLQKIGEGILATAPIIPTSSGGIGFGSLINKPGEIIGNYKNALDVKRTSQLKGFLDPNSEDGIRNAAENYANGNSTEFDYLSDGLDGNIKELEIYHSAVDSNLKKSPANSPEAAKANAQLGVIRSKYIDLMHSQETLQEKLGIFGSGTTLKLGIDKGTIQTQYLGLLAEAKTLQDKLGVLGSDAVGKLGIEKEVVQQQYNGLFNSVNTIKEKIDILNSDATLSAAINKEDIKTFYTALMKEAKITVDESLAILNSENVKKIGLNNQDLYKLLPKQVSSKIEEEKDGGVSTGKYKKK